MVKKTVSGGYLSKKSLPPPIQGEIWGRTTDLWEWGVKNIVSRSFSKTSSATDKKSRLVLIIYYLCKMNLSNAFKILRFVTTPLFCPQDK